MQIFSAKFTMTLPLVDNVHQAIIAFMRTSERGTWQVDQATASDAFELNFRRGNWKKALFGLSDRLVPGSLRRGTDGAVVPSTRAVTCRVLLRPTASAIKLRLEYQLHVGVFDEVPPDTKPTFGEARRATAEEEAQERCLSQVLARWSKWWRDTATDETQEMAAYLREALGLDELPAIAQYG